MGKNDRPLKICPRCKGQGEIYQPGVEEDVLVKCPTCNGRGVLEK